MSSSPEQADATPPRTMRRAPRPRPRITLPIFHLPPPRPQSGIVVASPVHTPMVAIPMTPVGGMPLGGGVMTLYPGKASEFMFKGFEGFKDFTMNTAKSGLSVGEKVAFWLYAKVRSLSKRWFTHIFLFTVVLSYSLLGAMLFVAVEGTHEDNVLKDIREERYALVRDLRNLSQDPNVDEKEWEGNAVRRMREFEEHLFESFKHGLTSDEEKVWSFWNAVFFCGTIYTTIGYGHISPSTTTGRAITIVYAIFGIPLFLILLADFGKLFTRGIKFLWAFVRRLYYTGSCRKVRGAAPMQEVMKGVQLVYDFATFRRPSQAPTEGDAEGEVNAQTPLQQPTLQPQVVPLDGLEPGTPAPSAFEVDDEFNLPISIAIFILLGYIFVGAAVYYGWEDWGFFESFYFVFISMSTIGFGDFVPKHPMYMMASIVYLVFGLALTSMCINVVQEKLSDSFRQASAKLGATMGLRVADEDGNVTPMAAAAPPPTIEVEDVQPSITKSAST